MAERRRRAGGPEPERRHQRSTERNDPNHRQNGSKFNSGGKLNDPNPCFHVFRGRTVDCIVNFSPILNFCAEGAFSSGEFAYSGSYVGAKWSGVERDPEIDLT